MDSNYTVTLLVVTDTYVGSVLQELFKLSCYYLLLNSPTKWPPVFQEVVLGMSAYTRSLMVSDVVLRTYCIEVALRWYLEEGYEKKLVSWCRTHPGRDILGKIREDVLKLSLCSRR
jgi:hypothetical protein